MQIVNRLMHFYKLIKWNYGLKYSWVVFISLFSTNEKIKKFFKVKAVSSLTRVKEFAFMN